MQEIVRDVRDIAPSTTVSALKYALVALIPLSACAYALVAPTFSDMTWRFAIGICLALVGAWSGGCSNPGQQKQAAVVFGVADFMLFFGALGALRVLPDFVALVASPFVLFVPISSGYGIALPLSWNGSRTATLILLASCFGWVLLIVYEFMFVLSPYIPH